MNPSSRYYHGILEFTDTCIYDFLMGMSYLPDSTIDHLPFGVCPKHSKRDFETMCPISADIAFQIKGKWSTSGSVDVCVCVGNADRHHYETYSEARPHGKLLHIDNGKTYVMCKVSRVGQYKWLCM